MEWTAAKAPTLDNIETLAREAFASLPEGFRALCDDLVFMVQDFPDKSVVAEMELESDFDILGLFHGADLAMREGGSHAAYPTMIFLYHRPILDYWAEHDTTLGDIVRHIVIHEIGHHFGLSDDDMDRIEERD